MFVVDEHSRICNRTEVLELWTLEYEIAAAQIVVYFIFAMPSQQKFPEHEDLAVSLYLRMEQAA